MITSTANKQIKELTQLIKKSKARREERVFVVEGIRMFVEAPKEQVQAVYASESFLKDPEHMACLQGYDYEEVSDSVFASASDTKTPQEAYDACTSEKRLVLIDGAAHAKSYITDPARVQSALEDFFENHLPKEEQV